MDSNAMSLVSLYVGQCPTMQLHCYGRISLGVNLKALQKVLRLFPTSQPLLITYDGGSSLHLESKRDDE